MPLIRAIGLMSGTSMDGVDLAFIETDADRTVRRGPVALAPYSEADRALLRQALADAAPMTDRRARPGVLAQVEAMVTLRHAEAVEAFLAAQNIGADTLDIIGFHGQTVLHKPVNRLTVQIGDGAALARRLGIPVAFDFRADDVAAGGQGAPLVPVYHQALVAAAGLALPVGVLNIGGVANITICAAGDAPLACDTGPGNALIDDLMLARTGAAIDRDGAAATKGRVNPPALAALMAHPFFQKNPPKSLDRNVFSILPVQSLSTGDAAATLAAFTAEAVAKLLTLISARLQSIIVCGGGAKNPVIMRELGARTGIPISTADSLGWSSDAMEAQAFAYLAARRLRNLPITFPSTTGVAAPMAGGIILAP